MEDKELKSVLTKVAIYVVVFVVFGGLFIKILINNFSYEDVSVGKRIDKEETFLLLIVDEKNKNPKDIIDYLNNNGLSIEIVNSDREKYYDDFLTKLNITKDDIVEPSLLDIRNGIVFSIVTDVKVDKDLEMFVNLYNGLEE